LIPKGEYLDVFANGNERVNWDVVEHQKEFEF
jgi:hypothetical protein